MFMHLTGTSRQLQKTQRATQICTQPAPSYLYMCQLTETKEREHPSRAWIIKKRQKSLVFFPPVSLSFVCLVNPSVVYCKFPTNKMEDHSLHGAHTTHVSNLTLYKYLSLTWRGLWRKQSCSNSVNPADAFRQFILKFAFPSNIRSFPLPAL